MVRSSLAINKNNKDKGKDIMANPSTSAKVIKNNFIIDAIIELVRKRESNIKSSTILLKIIAVMPYS